MKNTNKLVCKIAGVICMLALFSCLKGTVAYAVADTAPDAAEENAEAAAEENAQAATGTGSQAAVVSSRTTDHDIYLYIKGVSDIAGGTTVQIGNALCEDIQAAGVASTGIPIKTTILFDNSKSLSKNWGAQAVELAAGLIDHHAEGEEFRIATFADGLNVVADFSTDYEGLKAAAYGIEFLDQKSYLTDILYELLKQSGSDANYTRFVIITDGADDNEIKYTQAELTELMKSSGVVIHTVGVKTSQNNALLETLFSYARLTGGTYAIAEKGTDVESVRSAIDGDYSLLCLKLVPDAGIMDGSRKEAKLDLNTSGGVVTLTASLQMPFADVSSVGQAESAEAEEAAPEAAPEPEEEKSELPTIAVGGQPEAEGESESEAPKDEKGSKVPVVVIAVVIVAVIAVAAVLFILKGKKKKTVDVVITGGGQAENSGPKPEVGTPEMKEAASSGQQNSQIKKGGNTARLGGQQSGGGAGRTMRLNGGSGQNEVRQCYISLTDLGDLQKNFRVPIDTRVVVGREEGDILLGYNAAASYRHCEIIKKGNLFYVNDLKSSNGTFYGGMRVHSETPIMNGGILEVGKCKYKITIEN